MDTATLQKYVDKITNRKRRYTEQDCYAKGVNPAIFAEPAKSKPDNRIPVPIAKKAIDQYTGYMAKAGKIKYSGAFYDSTLKEIFAGNDEELVTAREFKGGLTFGVCYELHWTSDNGKSINFQPIPVDQCWPIWSHDLRRKLIGFVRYYEIEEVYYADYYDDKVKQVYVKNNKDWVLESEESHGYGMVPVNIGWISDDESNLFDHVRELIDFLDKIISGDYANESERFANAYLLMSERLSDEKDPVTGLSDRDRARQWLTLEFPNADGNVKDKVAFLTKEINTDFISLICKTCLDLIHEMIPMIDTRDDKMGASASGVAQEWKLMPVENKAAEIEANFSRFLQNRIYLIASLKGTLGDTVDGYRDVTIKFDRNLPRDMNTLVEWLSKSELSLKTRLGQYPRDIVPDVDAEYALIEGERPDVSVTDLSQGGSQDNGGSVV